MATLPGSDDPYSGWLELRPGVTQQCRAACLRGQLLSACQAGGLSRQSVVRAQTQAEAQEHVAQTQSAPLPVRTPQEGLLELPWAAGQRGRRSPTALQAASWFLVRNG